MALGVTLAGVALGVRRLAWLIEARVLANRSEGLGWPGPLDKSEGFRWAGLAQALSIKVRDLGGRAGPGPVDKSEGLTPRSRLLSICGQAVSNTATQSFHQ